MSGKINPLLRQDFGLNWGSNRRVNGTLTATDKTPEQAKQHLAGERGRRVIRTSFYMRLYA
jgi:hypothetical protein